MDALGGVIPIIPSRPIIIQKRKCRAQYVEQGRTTFLRSRQASASGRTPSQSLIVAHASRWPRQRLKMRRRSVSSPATGARVPNPWHPTCALERCRTDIAFAEV